MKRKIFVKICGLRDAKTLQIVEQEGADFVGFVFFDKSPRYISFFEAAEISQWLSEDVKKVGLFVNPSNDELTEALNTIRLDYIQLHGDETIDRVEDIRYEFGTPVIKSMSISTKEDIEKAKQFDRVADYLLFDSKAPKESQRPGGNALSFDWTLLKDHQWISPWFLAGGLTADNVGEAMALSGASAVDVSSGVESQLGVKDPQLIKKFIEATRRFD